MKAIPYGRQDINADDIAAVTEVLKADFLTQGPQISLFEENFAKYVDAKYAVAVSNGTAALHLSVLALGLKSGDKVITTSNTFAASANCIRYTGAEVVFADIDPETYLLDIGKVEKLLASSPKGTYKGIIPVDFAGAAVDLEAYRKLADKYDCWLLEDACHAPGAYFTDSNGDEQLCGNGMFAQLSVFSFHPVKHIAAGEGGMITTNDEALYKSLIALRTHGITKDADLLHENHGAWYYEMQALGFNYRITDFQAALGNSQLQRADLGLDRRRNIAKRYAEAFKDLTFVKGQSGVVGGHAYHLYVVEVDDRRGLYDYLRQNGIYAQVHYIPVHLHPYYKSLGWKVNDLPHVENYYASCLSLPMFPTLSDEEQDFVISKIKVFYS